LQADILARIHFFAKYVGLWQNKIAVFVGLPTKKGVALQDGK
jgi:hypothetical protein